MVPCSVWLAEPGSSSRHAIAEFYVFMIIVGKVAFLGRNPARIKRGTVVLCLHCGHVGQVAIALLIMEAIPLLLRQSIMVPSILGASGTGPLVSTRALICHIHADSALR